MYRDAYRKAGVDGFAQDGLADPVGGIGQEAVALNRIEPLNRSKQSKNAVLEVILLGQAAMGEQLRNSAGHQEDKTGGLAHEDLLGAFIALPENKTGMVHISEVANAYVSDIRQHLTEGQDVKVMVIGLENGKINPDKSFCTFVNPGKPIPQKVVELTGINDSMVADAPTPAEAIRQFKEFCGDNILVAHNANSFDMLFIRKAGEKAGVSWDENTYIDTLPMGQALFPGLRNYKLDTINKHLEIPPFNHHRAVDDAMALARIFEVMLSDLEEKDIHTVEAINTGLTFLQTIAPFYLLLAFKLTSDGLMRGCGMMGRFMATTLSDLFLRVVLAVLFSRWLGVNGIWLSWPVGWFVGTVLSMVFYRTFIYRQAEEKTTL